MKILVINPGAISTKIALFDGEKELKSETLRHEADELQKFGKTVNQKEFRLGLIQDLMKEWEVEPKDLAAVVGRGGPLPPLASGTYYVNQAMLDEIYDGVLITDHASILGAVIADEIAKEAGTGINAYIVDPVSVDEFPTVSRVAGLPDMERNSLFHALNIFAVLHKVLSELGMKSKSEFNGVGIHLGSGITIACIEDGKVIDVNNAMDGGPMAPTRAGYLPTTQLIKLCFSGKYTEKELGDLCRKQGGINAYTGTSDMLTVEHAVEEGDEFAELLTCAMATGIIKEVGAMCARLRGNVDAIYFTGSLAYNKKMVAYIKDHLEWIPKGDEDRVYVYPGEDEMWALAAGVRRVLDAEEDVHEYVRGGIPRDDILYKWRKENGYI